MVSQEVRSPSLYNLTRHNRDALGKAGSYKGMRDLIVEGLTDVFKRDEIKAVRVHVGGDFFHQDYFDAWMVAASRFPNKTFYAYTKSLRMWISAKDRDLIPENFKLTASAGGKEDELIEKHNLRKVQVVYHPEEAEALNLVIDHDDTHAMGDEGDFALLIHGPQRAGSDASKSQSKLKRENIEFAYSYKKKGKMPEAPKDLGYSRKPERKKTRSGSESERASNSQ